jgi:hypothetical protein
MLPLLNGFAGLIVSYLLLYVLKTTGGDLYTAAESLLGTAAVRLIALYFAGAYLLEAGLLLRQFADNTLLTALPRLKLDLAIGWFALLAAAILYAGIEPVARAGYLYLPFAVAGMLAILALLAPQYEPLYFTPWNGPGLGTVLVNGLRNVGVNIVIIVPFFLARSFQNARTIKSSILYGLGLSSVIKSLTMAAYLAVVGPISGRETVLPFYELARLVFVSRFVQRIEALFILLWVVMGILAIAINMYAALYILGRLFNLPAIRPLVAPVMVAVASLAMLSEDIVSALTFYLGVQTTVYSAGVVVITLVLFVASVVRNRRRKPCPADL